ncbi:MAG TPA: ABC transporter permease [Symbiobacteriaceae bacterium]|nr:ABC transporter permease [Symbiobacteriaceae bacterium]
MTTLISSEWYKIIHSKLLAWILTGVTAQSLLEVQGAYAVEKTPVLGQRAVAMVADGSAFLAIWIVAFVGFFVAADFQTSTLRNVLALGKNRTHVFLSKLIAACIAVTAIYATVTIVKTVGYTVAFGFGDMPVGEYLRFSSWNFFMQLFFHLTLASLYCLFAFLGKNPGMTILLGIGWLIGELVVMHFFESYPGRVLAFAAEYFPSYYIQRFYHPVKQTLNLDPAFIRQGIIVSLAYLVVPTVVGCALFKRSEVK